MAQQSLTKLYVEGGFRIDRGNRRTRWMIVPRNGTSPGRRLQCHTNMFVFGRAVTVVRLEFSFSVSSSFQSW